MDSHWLAIEMKNTHKLETRRQRSAAHLLMLFVELLPVHLRVSE